MAIRSVLVCIRGMIYCAAVGVGRGMGDARESVVMKGIYTLPRNAGLS